MLSSKGGGGWIMEKKAHLGETGGVQETGQSKFYHGGMKAFCSKSPFLLFEMYPH